MKTSPERLNMRHLNMMFDWKSIQQGSIPYLIPGGCHRGVNDKYKSVTNPLLDQGGSVGGEISMLASIPMLKSNGSIMVRYNDELPRGGKPSATVSLSHRNLSKVAGGLSSNV